MGISVSKRFLLNLGLNSLGFTALATLFVFCVFQHDFEQRRITFLRQYVQEKTDNVDRRFTNLTTLERSAIDALTTRMASMTPAEADRILNRQTRLGADGVRRSRDRLFDGYTDADGGRVYGVGAFLGRAKEMTPEERIVLASAFPIVARYGQAAHGDYDNFYFFAPRTRLVMFGPDRPDHLMFYRRTAPADLDIGKQEISRLVSPAADPMGETRCTSLQRLLQDKDTVKRAASACVTPVYVKGRYVGAFGISIRLDGFFDGAVADQTAGWQTLIIRRDGGLIAAPHAALVSPGDAIALRLEKALQLSALASRLNRMAPPLGVVRSVDGRDVIAYGRMKGPGWYLLIRFPAALAAAGAASSAVWILVVGLVGGLLQTLTAVLLGRKTIVKPLQALAATCAQRNPEASKGLALRTDELGVLARALQAERDRGDELLASLEHRVQRRTAELEKANAELEHANTEKSRFLANMSHELRTPLNGVIALSETLAREQATPRNVELAELIVSSGRLLEQVLSDILDFSKIEAGEMRIEIRPFDLHTVVSQVAELHRASAEAKGVDLVWTVEAAAEDAYLGDRVRLTQVLSNLLSNAVKFTETGRVSLTVVQHPQGLSFTVQDTGIGFTEAVRARLFNRFEQADVSIRRRFGGTGLGLAICRSLVELMGGGIDAESTPGQGSSFHFVLPLARAEAVADGVAEAAEPEMSLEGIRVLLAEDHPTNRKVIQLILDSIGGVELVMVENGQLALDALERDAFHVVLMDMQMPELDGLSATMELRRREAVGGAGRTPVIMLTANALDEHVGASLAAGADRHLSKPVHAGALIEAIATLVFGADLAELTEAVA